MVTKRDRLGWGMCTGPRADPAVEEASRLDYNIHAKHKIYMHPSNLWGGNSPGHEPGIHVHDQEIEVFLFLARVLHDEVARMFICVNVEVPG